MIFRQKVAIYQYTFDGNLRLVAVTPHFYVFIHKTTVWCFYQHHSSIFVGSQIAPGPHNVLKLGVFFGFLTLIWD